MQIEDKIYITPEGYKLSPFREDTKEVTFNIPAKTYSMLEKIAEIRDLPILALLKLYFSSGMRADMENNHPELQLELFEDRFFNRKEKAIDIQDVDVDKAA